MIYANISQQIRVLDALMHARAFSCVWSAREWHIWSPHVPRERESSCAVVREVFTCVSRWAVCEPLRSVQIFRPLRAEVFTQSVFVARVACSRSARPCYSLYFLWSHRSNRTRVRRFRIHVYIRSNDSCPDVITDWIRWGCELPLWRVLNVNVMSVNDLFSLIIRQFDSSRNCGGDRIVVMSSTSVRDLHVVAPGSVTMLQN